MLSKNVCFHAGKISVKIVKGVKLDTIYHTIFPLVPYKYINK